MDLPIAVSVILTAAMSLFETMRGSEHVYFDSAVALLFFLLIGRYLDARARGHARSAAEQLMGLRECDVRVVRPDGRIETRAAGKVLPGEVLQVAAGERIGVDGKVLFGASELDASLVSGESLPLPVRPGSAVFTGMVNLSAPLRVAATATGEATLIAEILRLMEAAEQGRARYVRLADRVARYYAPVVHLAAALSFAAWFFFVGVIWQQALLIAISVLIVTCPCALALAVPAVQVVATARLLRHGILLKSTTALERLAEVDLVVFDKTGTLTLGRPVLIEAERHDPAALRLAAGIAAASRHPLSLALCRAVPDVLAAADVRELPGRGLVLSTVDGEVRLGSREFCDAQAVEGDETGAPELWLAAPGRAPQRFRFADPLREDAAATVVALRGRGLDVELLSGDRAAAVEATARAVGIDNWRAGLAPGEKCTRLAALAAQGRHVAMVGDGLNDAPALAAAFVSLSPASAADVSQTAADLVFQGARLAPILEAIELARQSGRLVRQNLAFALGYNLLVVPLAIFGFVTPLVAAAAMSSSSLIVVANALRLGRGQRLAAGTTEMRAGVSP